MRLWPEARQLDPLPPGLKAYEGSIESRPLLVPSRLVARVRRLHETLLREMRTLLEDPATAEQLAPTVRLPSHPLTIGALRPDFVLDERGQPWICEINARFPVNAFFATAYLSAAMARAYPFRPIPGHERILEALRMPAEAVILKGRERGWDIHQLSLESGCRFSDRPGRVTILELHQDELFSIEGVTINDLRTIWLGHDKRLLGLLSKRMDGIIPTWTVGSAPLRPGPWVLKPNRLGKGEGLIFSHQVSPAEWEERIEGAPREWVVQPFIDSPKLEHQRLVGTSLSMNDEVLGMGIFRAAPGDLVNVAGGGRVLCPMLDET